MKDVVAGFAVRKNYEGEKDFDTTYKSVEIKKKLRPTGGVDENGEIAYVEEVVEVVTETPIKDVLEAQADSCGLEAYLRPYKLSGTEPPDVEVTSDVQDFTIFDNGDDLRVSGAVEKLYASLPADLRAQYGSPAQLLSEISEQALADYFAKLVAAKQEKTEVNKEGE